MRFVQRLRFQVRTAIPQIKYLTVGHLDLEAENLPPTLPYLVQSADSD